MPVSLHLYLAGVRRSYDEEKESYEPLARWARLILVIAVILSRNQREERREGYNVNIQTSQLPDTNTLSPLRRKNLSSLECHVHKD